MVEFLLCVEGGGDSSLLKTHCREGFRKFIKNSSYTGPMPRIAACGNRQAAYDDFTISLAQGQKAFLLVDSEDPVAESNQGKPWEHLAAREGDKWTKPTGATDGDCHLMVVCMESWFLSDRVTLKKFFGKDFHENSLPSVETPLELIPKAKVYDGLKKATGKCTAKAAYSKGEHSFELLGLIDSKKVIAASAWAERFFDMLNEMGTQNDGKKNPHNGGLLNGLYNHEAKAAAGPVTCLRLNFENDEARRAHFTEALRQKLSDPEFRKIEGFPVGTDEAIVTHSDPPYYTACPNPWLSDFIAELEAAKPDKPADYRYHREPFATDASEGKTHPIYKAHSYHTKVPHLAIVSAILHYTEPGNIVLDGFNGTCMTAVAAQWCGAAPNEYKAELEELWRAEGHEASRWGRRACLLNDLSPTATFIAANYNLPFDVEAFSAAEKMLKAAEKEIGWMYETLHTDGHTNDRIEYTVWSEIFTCPECSREISFLEEALDEDSKRVADLRTLDKQQGSYRQVTSTATTKQDLVISAYKPNGGLEDRFKLIADTEGWAWDFVRTHLGSLPVFVNKAGRSEIINECTERFLYDRMVAFDVQRGETISLSATEFYAGLTQRFAERNGMFFRTEQAVEYDKKRLTVHWIEDVRLFVMDEASARQWLREMLRKTPHTFQELHPMFIKEIGGWNKSEMPLELSTLLEQNFLKYDGRVPVPEQIHAYLSSNWKDYRGRLKDDPALQLKAKDRWYVPDANKAGDLEKLRKRVLIKEFEEYKTAKKLSVFRLEAVRAGFKKPWQECDYATIVAVADKIPLNVLKEDTKLLMWYDQAITRMGGE